MAPIRFDCVNLWPVLGSAQVPRQPVGEGGALTIPNITHIGGADRGALARVLSAYKNVYSDICARNSLSDVYNSPWDGCSWKENKDEDEQE